MAFRETLRSGISISAFTAPLALAGGLIPAAAMAQGSQQTNPQGSQQGPEHFLSGGGLATHFLGALMDNIFLALRYCVLLEITSPEPRISK